MKLFCSCILMAVITLSVVVLTPTKAFGLGLPPLPSLAAGDNGTVCKDADCQKGTCVANSNNFLNDLLFPYHCDCDPGTLNFNCSGSYQSPAPSPQTPAPPPASSDGELEGSCENLGITIPGFTPSSSGSPGSPGTPASNQNATTPSTGCRYALLGGNVLSTGVVVLTTCVYFALFW
ncbi:hypothetical protein CY35_07G099000 [Sphagnum magellanicum]|uniref:Uncharacterized protein n=1 Tax=Sphagnum magellanicum TaxID=128215 RepID=A0ACB8HNF7_9BRYO|nr:hypothetical protein CY35_07G099000 [Sphagnum magellanicum]